MIIRAARMQDVPKIQAMINYYADQELMLPRSTNLLYQSLRDFVVIEESEEIVGVGGMHILWADLAEIRSMAIKEEKKKSGIGRKIVEHFLKEAEELGVKKVFTLTYQPGFFEKCGFNRVDKDELPQKVWQECIHCVKFPNCDEIALIKYM